MLKSQDPIDTFMFKGELPEALDHQILEDKVKREKSDFCLC